LIYRGQSNRIFAAAWSPDGKRIVSGDIEGLVKVWDVSTGQTIRSYRGHTNYVFAVAWSPDGQRIATGSWDMTVQVWKAPS